MIKKIRNTLLAHPDNEHKPHIFRKEGIIAVFTIVAVMELSSLLGALVLPREHSPWAHVYPSVVALLTNEERVENNLSELLWSQELGVVAQAKAEDMARRGYFAHKDPDGRMAWHLLSEAGYEYQYAGENLAVNFADSNEVVEAWMASPTHRANILQDAYTETAIGMATGQYEGKEAVFIVQLFARPLTQVALPDHPEVRDVLNPEIVRDQVINNNVLGTKIKEGPRLPTRALTSSKTYGNYSLMFVTVFLGIILVLNWGRHHPHALAYGSIAVLFLASLIYVNGSALLPNIDLPQDSQNAAVVASLY